jgi:uncharacterized RDD family membrane protein YckC
MQVPYPAPTLAIRLLCLLYEMLMLAAVLFLAALPFVVWSDYPHHKEVRPLFQVYLWLVAGGYFTVFWHRGAQTPAMKAWRIWLAGPNNRPPGWGQCWLRFCLGTLGWPTGISLLWSLFDRDHQYLHDRLLGLRLFRTPH